METRRDRAIKTAILGACLWVGLWWGHVGGAFLFGESSGLKYFKNYPPEDYIIQPQNWCLVQDRRGIMYAANHGGVLEYDGVAWRSIMVPNQVVRSLAVDDGGTIYVGGLSELGYLGPDPQGQLKYISLVAHVDEDQRNFGSVWKTHATRDGIFFRTSRFLFRWDPAQQQMRVALASKQGEADKFNGSFCCGGKYFINQRSLGLLQLDNNAFGLIPGGKQFASIKTVFMVAPYDDSGEKLLIATREEGFFIYDGKEVTPLNSEAAAYLKEKKASHGIGLNRSPGHFAVATLRGGLVVVDRQGKITYRSTKEYGLLDNNAKYVFEDNQGNLWLALNKGISKIEYASPFSIYDDYSDLPGMVHTVTRHVDGFYAGTSEGLFYLTPGERKFKPVSGMDSGCWSLLTIGDSVLAATSNGVYRIAGPSSRKITGTKSYVLLQSRRDPRRVWVGMNYSLASLFRTARGKPEQ